ncbi:MAG: IS5 family transposase [Actinomycetota bacterium]|nr:IS5 family transposase [Actinomycetota bacterium]
MAHPAPRALYGARRSYPTDLSDAEWSCLKACLQAARPRTGRPRVHDLREVLDAIFYDVRSGCAWRVLPHDIPPWQTAYYQLRGFRSKGLCWLILKMLRSEVRQRVGKVPQPSAAVIDSQSAKTTEESAATSGYDAHKRVKGRKRNLLVDTLGLPLAVYVAPASMQDREVARRLLSGLAPLLPRLKRIWADGAYGGEDLATWCKRQGGWELEVVHKEGNAKGFEVLPKRWIVERTFGWLLRNRRLVKDYERRVQTSEALIQVAMIRLMLARLARDG